MQSYYDQFENCREHDLPYCADACPFKLDVLDFQEKLMKSRYNAAYKTFRNAVVFPDIVAALCPAYCEKACIRKCIDEAVHIKLLEKTVMAKAVRKKPNDYNLPSKKGKVAVIGAGISGLGFTLKLASKKYDVTIYEKKDKIGGHLWDLLPSEVFLADFDLQFKYEKYTLRLEAEIHNINDLLSEGYDVIYVATGKGGNDFGIISLDKNYCKMIGDTAVFAGGSLCGKDSMLALADGIQIARNVEVFLKTRTLQYPAAGRPSGVAANEELLIKTAAVVPTDRDGTYTAEETAAEVSRCIRCQCDACQSCCDLVGFFGKWPIAMRDEILLTCKPSKSLAHKNPAMRYINTCTQCDLLSEVCPGDINLCDMIKSARRKIHTLEKTPGAFRQYFLRDMEFANGEYAAVKRLSPSGSKCGYAFFPGCGLGALNPDYVFEPYKWLLSKDPSVGLLLRCCSIPIDWNGEEERHNREIELLKKDWEDLGSPVLIMACMSCQKHIREYIPQIEMISLYEILNKWGFKKAKTYTRDMVYSIFDPCSARNQKNVQEAIRTLAASVELSATELPMGDKHGCCGFGGMGAIATPKFSDYVAEKRSGLSENPYLVYCSNCRDVFTDNGKSAVHILDVLFDINMNNHLPQPNVTERRLNRVLLKEKLLSELWGEDMKEKPKEIKYDLLLSDEVRKSVNKQRVLEQDICEVIEYSEATGCRTLNPENNHYKAYKEIGHITCWVEYGMNGNQYEIFNVYTHRMRIELEAVFNGRKIDMR